MTKSFKDLTSFRKQLEKVVKSYNPKEKILLETVGKFVEKEAKNIIGHRQFSRGIYATWPELAEATKKEKARLGFAYNSDFNPLLRTGEMRDSITYFTAPHRVWVGSPSDILVYQEMGTRTIPPRPVLGLTMYRNKKYFEWSIGDFLMSWVTDTRQKTRVSNL